MIKANTKYQLCFSTESESTNSGVTISVMQAYDGSVTRSWQATSNGTEFFFESGCTSISTCELLYFKGKMNFNTCSEEL